MPTYRGISITLRSQYDALNIPEYPPPSAIVTPSPRGQNAHESTSSFKPAQDSSSDGSSGVAEVYVPIYPGSQFWIDYACPAPSPPVKFYFFKLVFQDQCLLSWGTGADENWSGKVMFGIFDGGTDFQDRQILEKRAFTFAKSRKDESEQGEFEIWVFRSRARRKERARFEKFETPGGAGDAIRLLTAGRMKKGEPKRMYTYALVDPVGRPFARFRYQFRTAKTLSDLNIKTQLRPKASRSLSPQLKADADFSSRAKVVDKHILPTEGSRKSNLESLPSREPNLGPSSVLQADNTSSCNFECREAVHSKPLRVSEGIQLPCNEFDRSKDFSVDGQAELTSTQIDHSTVTVGSSIVGQQTIERRRIAAGLMMNAVTNSFKRRNGKKH